MNSRNGVLFLCLFLLFFGCTVSVEKPQLPLVPILPRDYPLFADDLDRKLLEPAVLKSLEYFDRLPEDRLCRFGNVDYSVAELKESLLVFLDIIRYSGSAEAFRKRIEELFDIYQSVGSDGVGGVLFTGYYAPVLDGSREETEEYRYPVYKTPDDHIVVNLEVFREKYAGERIIARYEDGKILPYYTREEIDTARRLMGRGLEIAWLADPVDLFFLHIQGSGVVRLQDGSYIQISYDQANGHPYRSVGRLLIDRGKISAENMSLKSIKRYLREHPEEMSDILNHNESYVFFRIVEDGPVGSLNVPVTEGRSIATDSSLFPKGVLAFIQTKKPVITEDGSIAAWEPFSRFVLNQDTGGAIKGPGRVDLFCGNGQVAGIMAGHMKEKGKLYFLVKKRK